jgi:hypothetical protein
MNKYTVETDLPFDVVSERLASAHPRTLLIADSTSTITHGRSSSEWPAWFVGVLCGAIGLPIFRALLTLFPW